MFARNRLDGPRVPPANGQRPRQLVVLLHGFGADGNDLIELAPYLARSLPEAQFVSPHAPERCEMAPQGRQWWGIRSFSPAERRAGAEKAAPGLDAFLDAELERYGLTGGDLALVGFSQGTMMALQVGLRRTPVPAAIVGFSGALAAPETLAGQATGAPPVLLVHGDADEMLPVTEMLDAASGLGAAGVPCLWHVSAGIGHSIAQDGLDLAARFLADALYGRL